MRQMRNQETLATRQQALCEELTRVGVARFTAPDYGRGPIRHVVLFRFREAVTRAQRAEVRRRFLALATAARRDGRPYLLGIEAGDIQGGEGADQGFEQAYLLSFRSEGDRNYYVGAPIVTTPGHFDPAHAAFKDFVGPLLHTPVVPEGVLVCDFAVDFSAPPTGRCTIGADL